jgi:hypothetical protein
VFQMGSVMNEVTTGEASLLSRLFSAAVTLRSSERQSLLVVMFVISVRFEVSTVVTMKSGVFWDVMLCCSCKNRRFGGT